MGGREREFLFPFVIRVCYSCFWVSNFSFWPFSFLLLALLITPPGSKEGGQRFHFRRKLFNSHRPGKRLRTNLMSRYICFSQNGRFEELVSKAKNPGGFLRKKRCLGSIFGFFSCSVAIFGPICMKFWLQS